MALQTGELGNSSTSIVKREQQRVIPPAKPLGKIVRCENCVHFRARQISDQLLVGPFSGYGQHASRGAHAGRIAQSYHAEKGTNGGKAHITRLGLVVPCLLQVFQKPENHRRIQVRDFHQAWLFSTCVAHVLQ